MMIDNQKKTILLADGQAVEPAKALAVYLRRVAQQNRVIFGHENDLFSKVRKDAVSDVKDMTGEISGLMGIDTLALAGLELGISNPEEALKKAVEVSVEAAKEGALITLSAHMPNFGSGNIKKTEAGGYDFSACDFLDSKDLSGNCAKEVMPGGRFHDAFLGYLFMIAEYGLKLQEKGIPVLYRPFHENNGGWFWWGSLTDASIYKSMFRYTEDYLKEKGVHNFLYVYSPNGPFSREEDYLERYPGNEYIDVIAFDYYNDYNCYPAHYDESFFHLLEQTCQLVKKLADERGKIPAISETGLRVMKKDGSDNEGLLKTGNPVLGKNWYRKVGETAIANGIPYYLVWANFDELQCYVPYKVNDSYGHEMMDEFVAFYNWNQSVFSGGTGFYDRESVGIDYEDRF